MDWINYRKKIQKSQVKFFFKEIFLDCVLMLLLEKPVIFLLGSFSLVNLSCFFLLSQFRYLYFGLSSCHVFFCNLSVHLSTYKSPSASSYNCISSPITFCLFLCLFLPAFITKRIQIEGKKGNKIAAGPHRAVKKTLSDGNARYGHTGPMLLLFTMYPLWQLDMGCLRNVGLW